jgi:hypothetical protein
MKPIYLDHNIVRYFVRGFPPNFSAPAERAALRKWLSPDSDARYVLTDWHLVEAARECVHAPDPMQEVKRYADFFEGLNPTFLEGHLALERAEMAALAFRKWGIPAIRRADWMFASEFSQIALSHIPEILVGFNLRIYLRHLVQSESSRAEIHRAVGVASSSQQTMIDAYNDGLHEDAETRREIDRQWILSLLPERDPEMRWIALDRRQQLAAALSHAPTEVLQACPAAFAETVITEMRTASGGRQAKPQDALDLMHVVPALAYCSVFVTNDGHLRKHAVETCKRTGRQIVISAALSEAQSARGYNSG